MKWGWTEENKSVVPKKTDLDPAPDWLLNVVRCKCKDGSRNQCGTMLCSCRKNGLKCVTACRDFRGETCSNPNNLSADFVEEDDDFNIMFDM